VRKCRREGKEGKKEGGERGEGEGGVKGREEERERRGGEEEGRELVLVWKGKSTFLDS